MTAEAAGGKVPKKWRLFARGTQSLTGLALLLYSRTCTVTLGLLHCTYVEDGGGEMRLASNKYLKCWSEEHLPVCVVL